MHIQSGIHYGNIHPNFTSKLPERVPEKGSQTFDYWEKFQAQCKQEGKSKLLNSLLDKLAKNGNDNILALDYEPKNKNGVTNYYFQLYKNMDDLMKDRTSKYENQRLFSPRPIAGKEWVQEHNGISYKVDPTLTKPNPKYTNITDTLLSVLDNIVKPNTKENINIFIENQNKYKLPAAMKKLIT